MEEHTAPARALAPLLLVCALSAAACTARPTPAPGCRPWDYAADSTEPPSHCLFFPVGLAMDPLGDVLYASNSNADLSFGGATLVAIDVARHERAVGCFRRYGAGPGRPGDAECGAIDCQDSGKGRLGDSATVEAIEAAESDGRAAGGPRDFDRCYCSYDILDRNVVNCASDRFVLRRQTVKTGNFSGQIRLAAEDPLDWSAAAGKITRRLYLPVRGDPSVTYLDIERPARVDRALAPEPSLRCGAARGPADPVTLCDDAHRIQRTADTVPLDPDHPELGTRPRLELPAEPFSLQVDRGCRLPGYRHARGDRVGEARLCRDNAGNVRSDLYYEHLVSTHLAASELAVLDLQGPGGAPILADVRAGLLPATSGGQRGAYAAAPRVPGDLSQPWYMTSRLSGQISTFRVQSAGPALVPGLLFTIAPFFAGTGQDARDLVFEPGGGRAFLNVQTPPALLTLDTRPDPLTGVPVNQVLSTVDTCPGPARLALARTPRSGAGGRRTVLYIPCYQTGQVMVVDPDGGQLLTAIQVGRGPQTLVLNFGGEADGGHIDPCVDPYVSDAEARRQGVTCAPGMRLRTPQGAAGTTELPPRAYVTSYLEASIAVLDLDPRSLTYHRVVSRIGLPSPKQVQ